MRSALAVACCVLCLAGAVQAADPADTEALVVPRVGLPSADLLARGQISGAYAFRWADHEGRELQAHQFGVAYGITDRLELSYDHHDIGIDGRTAGNTFDVNADGFQLRYGQPILKAPGALFVQYRMGDGQVVRGGAVRIPPDSEAITFGAVRSNEWGGDNALHLLASATRSEVGSEAAWTLMGGAGVDYPLTRDLTAVADLALFKEAGDVSSFEAGLSGGVRYQRNGFHADLAGTFLPSGTPLAGSALGDASVFVLDPVFANEPIVRDFQNDSLGFVSLRVGYTTTW